MQVSRNQNLNIPKKIETNISEINSLEDAVATNEAIAISNNEKFKKKEVIKKLKEQDKDFEAVQKIPSSANDLMVITVIKKLGAYIITVTEKSPAKYRGVFVNRMQNYSLEILEELLKANFVRLDTETNKKLREDYQIDAIVKLKMLGYIAMVAESSKCILFRQYKQISILVGEAINLITAWKKSDDERFKKNKK